MSSKRNRRKSSQREVVAEVDEEEEDELVVATTVDVAETSTPRSKRRRVGTVTSKAPIEDEDREHKPEPEPAAPDVAKTVVKKERITKRTKVKVEKEVIETVTKRTSVTATVRTRAVTTKIETKKEEVTVVKKEEEEEESEDERSKPKEKKKRKTKAEKEAEMGPLAERTLKMTMKIGAHVSIAKGVQNSVTNSLRIGGNAFALFLKSQRKWTNPPLDPNNAKLFKELCKEHKYDAMKHVVPHGSYLVNLAQFDKEKAKQAYECFVEDLQRCEKLGIGLYNFHPGSTLGEPRAEAFKRIADALNKAHKETKFVRILIENMAGHGNIIGGPWEDLRDIIALVKDKKRIGVCLDTCHAFAAGHDLRTPSSFEKVMAEFDEIVGLKYLCALHLNDSKAPLGSNLDRHENIGLGFLGLSAFRNVVNCASMKDLPMVLETPLENDDVSRWAGEIKLLESLVGVSEKDPVFLAKEKELAKKGEKARATAMEAFEKKMKKRATDSEKKKKPKAEKFNGKITDFVKKSTTSTAKKRGKKAVESETEESSEGESSCAGHDSGEEE